MECVFFFIIFLLYIWFVIFLFSTWATYFFSFKSSTCCFWFILKCSWCSWFFANLATDLIFGLVVLLSTRLFRANSSSLDITGLLMPLSVLSLLFSVPSVFLSLIFQVVQLFLSFYQQDILVYCQIEPTYQYWKEINFR